MRCFRFIIFGSFRPLASCCDRWFSRSEEHTSELQSRLHLVCRLLLEKKKSVTARIVSTQAAVSALALFVSLTQNLLNRVFDSHGASALRDLGGTAVHPCAY